MINEAKNTIILFSYTSILCNLKMLTYSMTHKNY